MRTKSEMIDEAARSRSPALRASRLRQPKVKTWVLVRPVGVRRWSESTPALVSKVTAGLMAGDARITVLVPNILRLKHSFGGRPFTEISELRPSEMRPYTQGEHAVLKEALLRAIRDVVVARTPSKSANALDDKPSWLPATSLACGPRVSSGASLTMQMQSVTDVPPTSNGTGDCVRAGLATNDTHEEVAAISMKTENSASEGDSLVTRDKDDRRSASSIGAVEWNARECGTTATPFQDDDIKPIVLPFRDPEPAPVTPEPRSRLAALERRSPDHDNHAVSSSLALARSNVVLSEIKAAVGAALAAAGGGDVALSRMELYTRIAKQFTITAQAFDEALECLNRSNKIFTSGELVFAVCSHLPRF